MQGSAEAELAYARLEALCQAMQAELQQDLRIHDAAVLPNFVNLPKVSAAEYGRVSSSVQAPQTPGGRSKSSRRNLCLQTAVIMPTCT